MSNAGLLSGKNLQRSIDAVLNAPGDIGTVFDLVARCDDQGTPQDEFNPALGTIVALLQETEKAAEMATAIGCVGQRAALAYFVSQGKAMQGKPVPASQLVAQGRYWRNAAGEVWEMHSLPAMQRLSGTVVGIALLLLFVEKPPAELTGKKVQE